MFELPKKIKMIAAALTIVGLGLLVIGFNTDYSQASDGHDDHAVAQKDHDALSTHGDYPGEAHAAMIQASLMNWRKDMQKPAMLSTQLIPMMTMAQRVTLRIGHGLVCW